MIPGRFVGAEVTFQPETKIVNSLKNGNYVPLYHFIDRVCTRYPKELVDGLTKMFHRLDRHEIRDDDRVFGTLAVQRYALLVRMEWHSLLDSKEIFDIAEIRKDKLDRIYDKINKEQTAEQYVIPPVS